MEIQNQLLDVIHEKLSKLELAWKRMQGMLLSEDDVKCHLFRLLHEENQFLASYETRDSNIYGTPIHTEIKFFDENGELKRKHSAGYENSPRNTNLALWIYLH